jgi:acyl transferase domain-containing protein/non-ribosomal peptide synthetase component F/SAM-dependent methyltransferase/NAD(P)-dependent dehydrogenase (short-subunit alcohol dehydrogenase family)/acyl carrier protein
LLKEPRDVLRDFGESNIRPNLEACYSPDGEQGGRTDAASKAYIFEEDPTLFDAAFFNISPLEAAGMDPQQRILLETVYESLEAAGCPLARVQGAAAAVFVGCMTGDYRDMQLRDPETMPRYLATGTAQSILANRVSYVFDLKGPSLTVDTACSSSLVCLHLAVQSLRNGECELAIVAGTNLILDSCMFIAESSLHMLSPDSRSRMWDSAANGYARGEGVASLVLKPLARAVNDGDHIECVIRNTAVNSDGRTKGITMPSARAQTALIRKTYLDSGLDPVMDRPQFFECHGTGTLAGDPVEAQAVHDAFFPSSGRGDDGRGPGRLLVGSVKTVIGHLEGCAGIAGVLRASLAIQNRTIPPNMHFHELNPAISPFYTHLELPTKAVPWPSVTRGPRRASVNSFGFGGTNAHAILESYEPAPGHRQESGVTAFGPFLLSAQTETSLAGSVKQLMEHLEVTPEVNLADLGALLQTRRSDFPIKTFFTAADRADLIRSMLQHLADVEDGRKPIGLSPKLASQPPEMPGTLGIFTGQGAQWPAMGAGLFRSSPVFRQAIEECERALASCPDPPSWSLQHELLAPAAQSRVSMAALSQPLCTAVQIGLVDLLRACGIRLDAVVGHSSGEIAAVYAAGIISAADAIRIAYYRGFYAGLARGAQGQKGAMLAVAIPYDASVVFCEEGTYARRLATAASNSPSSVTMSGDADAIEEAKAHFDKHKIFTRLLRVDTAYHSHHMGPCADPYARALEKCDIQVNEPRPDCVWVSSVHGDTSLLDGDLDYLRAEYWVQNMTQPVLFSQALQTSLWAGGPFDMVIEVGCHPVLKGPVSQTFHTLLGASLPYTGMMSRDETDGKAFAAALGHVWQTLGPSFVDFDSFIKAFRPPGSRPPQVVKNLPPYAWDHEKSHWREPRISQRYRLAPERPHQLLGRRMPDDSKTQMRWRNIFRLEDLPWLRGHCFQGQALFPAAGYVSMALKAAMAFASGRDIRLIEVKRLKMNRALVVEENKAGVEVLFSMSQPSSSPPGMPVASDVLVTEISCQTCSDEAAGELVQNCSGQVLIHLGPPSGDQLSARCPDRRELRPVDVEAFYASVMKLGLNYQGHFRGLKTAERALDQATASASWPEEVDVGFGNVPHPGFLDTGFQSLFVAYSSPISDQLWAPYLPVEIEMLSFDPHVHYSSTGSAALELEAFVTHGSAGVLRGDVHFFTDSEGGGRCGIQVEGVVLRSFTEPSPSNDRLLFAKTVWKADILGGRLDEELEALVASAPHEPDLVETIERVALHHFQRVSAAIAPGKGDQVKWHHQQLLRVIRQTLAQIRQGVHPTARREWLDDTAETVQALAATFPAQIDIELGQAVGANLVDIITGRTEPLQVMMENDMLNRLYMEGCGFLFLNNLLSQVVSRLTHKHPRMDLLEIGAGTGGATRRLLDVIGHSYRSYTYTDISSGFFGKAADKFADHRAKMTFRVLDIERAPAEQGYPEHAYDVVLASNVLHATMTLRETLVHTRSLLRPGGYLVLAEVTGQLLRFLLLMGALPGWWLGVDDGRTSGPGSTLLRWDEVLRETGFSGVDISALDNRDPSLHSCSVIVSQALDEDCRIIREPLLWSRDRPGQPGPLVIVGGGTLATSRLIQQTQKQLPFPRGSTMLLSSLDLLSRRQVPQGACVLCLAELDEPIFGREITTEWMRAPQTLFGSAANVLWVTQGRLGGEPLSNMTVGLGRALREEMPHLSLQFLDIGQRSALTAPALADIFLRLVASADMEKREPPSGMLWTTEPELYYDGRNVYIPRVVFDMAANNRANASRRTITEEVTLEDSPVELRFGDGRVVGATSLERCERSRTAAGAAHLTAIKVRQSTRLHPSAAFGEVLCLGVVSGTDRMVMAFAKSHASSVHVPPEHVLHLSDSESRAAEGNEADFLVSAARQVIAATIRATLDHVEHGTSSTVVVHGAEEGLARVLGQSMKAEERKEVLHFSSSCGQDCLPAGWLSLHPSKTADAIRRTLPTASGLLIDLSEDAQLSSRLPPTWTTQRYSSFASLIPSRQLRDAALRAAAAHPGEEQFNVIRVEELSPAGPASLAAYPVVLDWTHALSLAVEIKPLDVARLVHPDKTYLMVGMTSELGLSLCRYLIVNGARHLVLVSRNPSVSSDWLQGMARYGATVRVCAADAADMTSLRPVVDMVAQDMPPVGGVCNAALALCDKLFADMGAEEMQIPLHAKVQGTKNLDALFSDAGSTSALDFFICFSSLGSIVGNPGQSNYHAANMFMAGLAAQRRLRGLPASVMHLGLVVDVGYVARAGPQTANQLRSRYFFPLSEPDVHNMLAEAIVASNPSSERMEIICGLEPCSDAPEARRPAPWISNPRFSHMVTEATKGEAQEHAAAVRSVPIRQLIEEASGVAKEAVRILTATFLAKVETMLQLSQGTATKDVSLVDLGCDSLLAVEIRTWFLKELAVEVPILKLLSGETIADICTTVANQIAAGCSGKPPSGEGAPEPDTPRRPESPVESNPAMADRESAPSTSEPDTPVSFETRPATSSNSEAQAEAGLSFTSGSEDTPAELDFVRCANMSYAQARLWFLREYLPDPTSFNIAVSFKAEGRLDQRRLGDAFRQVLSQHEGLRTCFVADPHTGRPTQGVLREPCGFMDHLSTTDGAAVEHAFANYKTRRWQLEFGDGIHATLISHGPTSHTFLLGHHHILMDGMSLYLFLRDLDRAYSMASSLSPVRFGMQPCDFARRELEQSTPDRLRQGMDFWKAEHDPLPDTLPLLPFARVKSRKPCEAWDGNRCRHEVSSATMSQIKTTCRALGVTPFHYFLAVVQVLLSKLLDVRDICIGVTDANRADEQLASSIGFFLNLLPLRLRVGRDARFADVAKATAAKVLAAYEHSNMPFDLILDAVGAPRSPGSTPLFQVAVNYRPVTLTEVSLGDCRLVLEAHHDARNPYDLAFNMVQSTSGTCLVELTTRDYLYSAETCRFLLALYIDVLERLSAAPFCPVSEIRVNQVPGQPASISRGPDIDFGWPATLVERFDEMAGENPAHTAVVDAWQRVSYQELHQMSSRISVSLMNQGCGPGPTIAVLLEPSVSTVAVMLAILRIGGVYLPLDLSIPQSRHAAMVDDARAPIVVCHGETAVLARQLQPLVARECTVFNLATDMPPLDGNGDFQSVENVSTDDSAPAFLLYSSGSTGVPKGIVLPQRGIVNYLAAKSRRLGLIKTRVVTLQQSSTGFDMSIAQTFNGLANGGTVVMAPRSARGDPVELVKLMRDHEVTFTICTPSECLLWLRYGNEFLRGVSSWTRACLGGEVVTEQLKDEFRRLGKQDLIITE